MQNEFNLFISSHCTVVWDFLKNLHDNKAKDFVCQILSSYKLETNIFLYTH